MLSLKHPFLRIVVRPTEGWRAVDAARPGWGHALLGQVLPLALLPAIAWPLGHALDPIGPQEISLAALTASFAATLALCFATVLLTALAIYVLAPLFQVMRDWDRAVSVAAYSSAPALLAAPLLVSASLAVVTIVALFHSCVLCSIGLRSLLGCRGEDAAMYVAAIAIVTGVAGMGLGALGSAAGIL